MTLPRFSLRPGVSILDQVVFAATKALVSGEFQPRQPFPSVRALAPELKIHPNTAQKAVRHLIQERRLDVQRTSGRLSRVVCPHEPAIASASAWSWTICDMIDAIDTRRRKLAGTRG